METQKFLVGMTWDHPRAYDSLVAASAEFANHTGVQIKWKKRSLQDFADVPIEQLARTYDLIVLDHPHVGQIAESGCLQALPPMPTSASLGGSVESYHWKGRSWAWPIDAACQMAVIRSDLIARLPDTWEALMRTENEDCRLLTPLKPVDAFDMMLTLLASRGEETLPINPSEFCTRESGLAALHILKHLFKRGPAEAVSWNPIQALEVLAGTDDFAASPCLFGYINYARPGFRKNQLDYVDLPTFEGVGSRRSILGGAGIGVSSLRDSAERAQAFAAWVSSEPVQSGVYLQNEGQPAHRESWQKKAGDPLYRSFLRGGYETISTAWTRPRDAWFLNFVDDICDVFPAFFQRDQNEESFLNDLNTLYRHHTGKGAI
ncbi:MAG: extracellular solute-binding protein [Stappiaceae bacterium]